MSSASTSTATRLTQDKVVRREFRLQEGDAFNTFQVKRSQDRINSLGFFQEKLEVEQKPGSARTASSSRPMSRRSRPASSRSRRVSRALSGSFFRLRSRSAISAAWARELRTSGRLFELLEVDPGGLHGALFPRSPTWRWASTFSARTMNSFNYYRITSRSTTYSQVRDRLPDPWPACRSPNICRSACATALPSTT